MNIPDKIKTLDIPFKDNELKIIYLGNSTEMIDDR